MSYGRATGGAAGRPFNQGTTDDERAIYEAVDNSPRSRDPERRTTARAGLAALQGSARFATGTVVTAEIPANPTSSADDATYTIDLTGVWKGDAASTITLRAALSSASCGIEGIREGMVLTVFATRDGGDWRTNICDGTGLDAEQTAIAALGEPTPVAQSPRPSDDPPGRGPGGDEVSGEPTTEPPQRPDAEKPGDVGRYGMTVPLIIIAAAGLIAGALAWFRE